MNILKNIPVYLLALIYLVFGSNYFLQFLKMPPMAGDAGTFVGVIYSTKFLLVVKSIELICVVLMVLPKTKALGLLLIAPISVSILLFEILIVKQPAIGILLVALNAISIFQSKEKYFAIVN